MHKNPDRINPCIAHLLVGESTLEQTIRKPKEKVHILPANTYLSQAEVILNRQKAVSVLSNIIRNIKRMLSFDVCLIDTPPALGFLTANAVIASQALIIPAEARALGLRGLSVFFNFLQKTGKKYDIWILPTFYRKTILARQVIQQLSTFPAKLLNPIPLRVSIAETALDLKNIEKTLKDYRHLIQEVLIWVGKN